MRALIGIALACCLGLAYAALEPSKNEIDQAGGTYQQRGSNQHGSRDNPFVVETIPAERSEIQAGAERTEKEKKSLHDALVAWGTAGLAGITLVLVIVTADGAYGWAAVSGDEIRLFFVGFIDYIDPAGAVRQTGFLRRYNSKTKAFDAADNPDYEYQD